MSSSIATWLHKRPSLRLTALLTAPVFWLAVAYLGSLASLLITSFFTINTFTGDVIRQFNLNNFHELLTNPSYRNVILRTLGIAIMVTVICTLLGLVLRKFSSLLSSHRCGLLTW
jgi:putative spermidine/putrescine transport system permease protein